ncbi:hypothetical protein VNI00_018533 [Paramarasmius palmivorus]|uniref:Uncharacterized protein n=1 Tax=Paramarasmius palmivorus TaxID=297713 RepID=A0AAW0AXT5_9AGAR
MPSQPTRQQKSAATRARNHQRQLQEEQRLQQQVAATGGRRSKKRARDKWEDSNVIRKRQRTEEYDQEFASQPQQARRQSGKGVRGSLDSSQIPRIASLGDDNIDSQDELSLSEESGSENERYSLQRVAVDDEVGGESDKDDLCSVGSQDRVDLLAAEKPNIQGSSPEDLFDEDLSEEEDLTGPHQPCGTFPPPLTNSVHSRTLIDLSLYD